MGKITVQHYLNTNLKPDKDDTELYYPLYISITVNRKNIKRRSGLSNTIECITENEFKNKFKDNPTAECKINYEKDLYVRIIKLFLEDIEKKTIKYNLLSFFDLKGYRSKDNFINLLNAYIDFYAYSIFDAIEFYCTSEIEKEIFDKIAKTFNLSNPNEVSKIFKYQSPLKEIEFIYDNLSIESIEFLVLKERLRSFLSPYNSKYGYDIPLIDWLNNIIQPMFIDFLKTYKRNSEYYIRNNFIIDNQLIDKYIKIIDRIINSSNYIEFSKKSMIIL